MVTNNSETYSNTTAIVKKETVAMVMINRHGHRTMKKAVINFTSSLIPTVSRRV